MLSNLFVTLLTLSLLYNGSHAQICPKGCLNGGTCSLVSGTTNLSYCKCPSGFSGSNCDIGQTAPPTVAPTAPPTVAPTGAPNIQNFCNPNNCLNGGPCFTLNGTPLCVQPAAGK